MEKSFIFLVSDFIDTNGKKILDQPDRFKSLFLDFSQNEYRAEAQIFSQFLASKQAQELKNSDDVDTDFLKGIAERFYQTYFFDRGKCEQVVTAYAFFLGLVDKKTFTAGLGQESGGNAPAQKKRVSAAKKPAAIKKPAAKKPATKYAANMPQNISTQNMQPPVNTTPYPQPVVQKDTKSYRAIIIAAMIILCLIIVIAGVIINYAKPKRSTTSVSTESDWEMEIITEMEFINGGIFIMGSPVNELERSGDETQHQVIVSSFFMGKYPVTQGEYLEIMGTNPSHFQGEYLPVENVSWYDAIEYCNALSSRQWLTPAYKIDKSRNDPNNMGEKDNVRWLVTLDREANGYRLPTEAEWEYACRAGTTTPFNTGNNITTGQANFDGNWPYGNNVKGILRDQTTPVNLFNQNAWGLHDMHGNVCEWCWDWYDDYPIFTRIDPMGASSGVYRIIRGGFWANAAENIRSAVRNVLIPSYWDCYVGFRLARNAN